MSNATLGARDNAIMPPLASPEPMMNPEQRITFDPEVCGGRPCMRGMRIRVADILEMLGHGVEVKEILADFSDLEEADIRAGLPYAARRTDCERLAA
ncbi:MAG: DUF433 domain-containing protein [Rhodanobacteraceae bacterium]